MTKKFLYLILFLIVTFAGAQTKTQENKEPEFEMKRYYFVFFNAAPIAPELDSAKMSEILTGHVDNITQMWKDGKCLLAGPFMDEGEMRGFLILDVASEEDVKELCSRDPAIINGQLVIVIKPWYGPAGLHVYVQPKAK